MTEVTDNSLERVPDAHMARLTENGGMFKDVPNDNQGTECGYGRCKPKWLQRLNNPKCLLVFLSGFAMLQGFVVNGINNVNTSTIERRFHLPSSQVGIISSSYDLSAAILGILISYYGSGRNKARWLWIFAVVMGMGSFIMSLPHFTAGLYEWGQNVTIGCHRDGQQESCYRDSTLQAYLYVLILGQFLHGLGGTTLYTVGVSYIDDSVPAESSALYIGVMYAFATLGPALGYIIGGQMLSVYVDFNRVDPISISITPEDPRWVGAWWVSFLVASSAFLMIAVPISMYGVELPIAKTVRETRVSEMHGDDGTYVSKLSGDSRALRNLPIALWQILRIPPFLPIALAGASEGLITSGFATFMPKYIQNQFGVTAGWASMLTGFMAVPGAAGGQFTGGYLAKRLQLKVQGCLRIAIIASVICIIMAASLWTRCKFDRIAGVTMPYNNSSSHNLPELVTECNSHCGCNTEFYEPVCDKINNIQYFSPCHAGCNLKSSDGKFYSQCMCVPVDPDTNSSSVAVGKCESDCHLMYMFLPFIFILIFLTFMPSPPVVSATLRCIHESQRTTGIGLKWLIVRLLGTVPGPIFFGAVIDSTCVIWRENCDEKASCWIYNNSNMSRNFFILFIVVKAFSIAAFITAYKLYKLPVDKKVRYLVGSQEVTVADSPSEHDVLGDKSSVI
ncbi:hypothetical protein ACJMK2_004626 [Sinanodonta woodiana]